MKLSYDGTRFHGWQTQPHKRTVQKSVSYALTRFAHKRTIVTGSGRTDTGVHAMGQCAHFDYEGNATGDQIRKGLRKYLPDDVKILSITAVAPEFHARYDACLRHYEYLIAKDETPFNRQYMGYFPRKKVNFAVLQECAPCFLGEHNFSSFSKPNPAVPNHICDVIDSSITEYESHFVYTVKATRFLHNMVRRMVGAMINISHLGLSPETIYTWIAQQNPRQTIIFPAPPQGLYLMGVKYPDHQAIAFAANVPNGLNVPAVKERENSND